jgi:hypothetical protein
MYACMHACRSTLISNISLPSFKLLWYDDKIEKCLNILRVYYIILYYIILYYIMKYMKHVDQNILFLVISSYKHVRIDCVCTYVCMHVCILCMYACMCVITYVCVMCVYVYIYISIMLGCVYTYICVWLYLYVIMYACTYVCRPRYSYIVCTCVTVKLFWNLSLWNHFLITFFFYTDKRSHGTNMRSNI